MTSLLILARCMQNYSHVRTFGSNQLIKNEATEDEIQNYKKFIDNEIEYFKDSSIKYIVRNTPDHFMPMIQFDDWDSAMRYLDNLNKTRMTNRYDTKN
tara:strand:- start:24 stop:317 length:294 start_codon:yes stop_codon:yes gene_type:complete